MHPSFNVGNDGRSIVHPSFNVVTTVACFVHPRFGLDLSTTGGDGVIVHPQYNVGNDGRSIVHPQYNVGEETFQHETIISGFTLLKVINVRQLSVKLSGHILVTSGSHRIHPETSKVLPFCF